MLYIRGKQKYGDIDTYLKSFRESGFQNINGAIIEDCGHFSPEEQPEKVASLIEIFKKNIVPNRPGIRSTGEDFFTLKT